MRRLCSNWSLLTAALLVTLAISLPAHAQNKLPDSTLFTIYSAPQPATQINWSTCGSLPQSSGCYGAGNFGPFTNVCSIVQNVPGPVNLTTVLRYIYILDEGSSAGGATLTVYKRTDTVSQTNDTINITRITVVPLTNLVAGPGSTCYLAQNPTNVYAATSESPQASVINKTTYNVTQTEILSGNVTGISADSYGYVTIVQGSGPGGTAVYGPNGSLEQDGGGSYFMINPIDGVNPASVPAFDLGSLLHFGYSSK